MRGTIFQTVSKDTHMHVLILTDIEGSSGCWSRSAAKFMTPAWRDACRAMTLDIRGVVLALKAAGVNQITVHDFHRTGYNIMTADMPAGCRVVSGYKAGPVPGLGHPGNADILMMIGMHAPSGSNGFLAHTLTSRVAALHVNGRLLSEAELFSAALHPYGIRPVFLSGCPLTCEQAAQHIKGITTFPIDKSKGPHHFDAVKWRKTLADKAITALSNEAVLPYRLDGPFSVQIKLRDGSSTALKLSRRWRVDVSGDTLHFECATFADLYDRLLCICYLTPFLARYRSLALDLYSFIGRLGHMFYLNQY